MSNASHTLAGPPISDHCVSGVKYSGNPTGKKITIGDVPTYISEPKDVQRGVKKVILFYSDVWGPFHINNQLLQDYFAQNGTLKVMRLTYGAMTVFSAPICRVYRCWNRLFPWRSNIPARQRSCIQSRIVVLQIAGAS